MQVGAVQALVVVLDDQLPVGLDVVDDPAAELDARSLDRLLAALAELSAELIFTALTPEHLRPEPGFPVFHVERGGVRGL